MALSKKTVLGAFITGTIGGCLLSGFLSLFYTFLLTAHGFKVTYRKIFIVLCVILTTLNLISIEAFGVGAAIIFISVFILTIALFVRQTGNQISASIGIFRDKTAQKPEKSTETITPNENGLPIKSNLSNYSGFIFHIVLIVLIILSTYTYSTNTILNNDKINYLILEAYFQFTSSILLLLIGFINPFSPIKEKHVITLEKISRIQYLSKINLLSRPRNWIFFKGLICLLLIVFFIKKGYLVLPKFGNDYLINGTILLLGIFIITNVVQLIQNPTAFAKKNLLRITILFQSAFLGLFVAAVLVVSTLLFSSFLGINIDKLQISSESILFLGFNIVMAYVELKVIKANANTDI